MIDEKTNTDDLDDPDNAPEVIAPSPATRDDDGTDAPPPLSISGKGPMDQNVPDVATGSTPVTRRDD